MFTRTQDGSDRLKVWRNFRKRTDITTAEQIAEAFDQIKPLPRYLDFYTPESWPNVFDIVQEGQLCTSGITLILASTLHYFGFISTDKIKLVAISNHINGSDGLVLVHQGLCYNFIPGQIVTEQYMIDNCVRFHEHIITSHKLFA